MSSPSFDPYKEWLGIPPEDQPPTFYRLLGIDPFESDHEVIDAAAKRRTAYLHPMASGPDREAVQQLLGEVAKARRTLLSSASKASYDESLRSDADAARPTIEIQIDDDARRGRSANPTRSSARSKQANRKSASNAWWNSPRLHAGSVIVLLAVSIGTVLYLNSRPDRVAAKPAKLANETSQSSSIEANTRPSQRGLQGRAANGDSSGIASKSPSSGLTLATPKSVSDRDSAASPPRAARSTRPKRAKVPRSVRITLDNDWDTGLTAIDLSTQSFAQKWNESGGENLVVVEDGKLVLLSLKSGPRGTTLKPVGVNVTPGQTVQIKTNLRAKLPDTMRVGLALGPMRVRLESKKNNLQVRAGNQTLGTVAPNRDAVITLSVSRDREDFSAIQWWVDDGAKCVGGRVRFDVETGLELPIAVFCSVSKKDLADPIWIGEPRFGTLNAPPTMDKTTVVRVKAP